MAIDPRTGLDWEQMQAALAATGGGYQLPPPAPMQPAPAPMQPAPAPVDMTIAPEEVTPATLASLPPTLAERQAGVEGLRTLTQAAAAKVGLPFESAELAQGQAAARAAEYGEAGAEATENREALRERQGASRARGDEARAGVYREIASMREALGNRPEPTTKDRVLGIIGAVLGAKGGAGAAIGQAMQLLGSDIQTRIGAWEDGIAGSDRMAKLLSGVVDLENQGIERELAQELQFGKLAAADTELALNEIAEQYKGQEAGIIAEKLGIEAREAGIKQQMAAGERVRATALKNTRNALFSLSLPDLEAMANDTAKIPPGLPAELVRGVYEERIGATQKRTASELGQLKSQEDIEKLRREGGEKQRALQIEGLTPLPGVAQVPEKAREAAKAPDEVSFAFRDMRKFADDFSPNGAANYARAMNEAIGALNAVHGGVLNPGERLIALEDFPEHPYALAERAGKSLLKGGGKDGPGRIGGALSAGYKAATQDLESFQAAVESRSREVSERALKLYGYQPAKGAKGAESGPPGTVKVETTEGPKWVSPEAAKILGGGK